MTERRSSQKVLGKKKKAQRRTSYRIKPLRESQKRRRSDQRKSPKDPTVKLWEGYNDSDNTIWVNHTLKEAREEYDTGPLKSFLHGWSAKDNIVLYNPEDMRNYDWIYTYKDVS